MRSISSRLSALTYPFSYIRQINFTWASVLVQFESIYGLTSLALRLIKNKFRIFLAIKCCLEILRLSTWHLSCKLISACQFQKPTLIQPSGTIFKRFKMSMSTHLFTDWLFCLDTCLNWNVVVLVRPELWKNKLSQIL